MRVLKISVGIAVILIIAIQFFRPDRVKESQVTSGEISAVVMLPDNVQITLKKACYDCHSDNPVYPWYFNIQPVGWLLASHIEEARKELNFSQFANYAPARQFSKLDGIIDEIKDGEMPLSSYKLMHKEARLNVEEKESLLDWAETAKQALEQNQ